MRYKKWLEKQNFNAKGKTIIVTGANSGIGFFATKYFALLGANVIMACRNPQKAEKAKRQIECEIPNSKLYFEQVDLASKSSINVFAEQIKNKYGEIDILINNAGVYMPSQETTTDGFDMTIGTNFVGTCFLTECLKPLLKYGSRIVFTTSIVDNLYRLNRRNPILSGEKSKYKSYKKSKFLISCYAQTLKNDVLVTEKNITIISAHPGITSTDLFSSKKTTFSKVFSAIAKGFLKVFTHSPEKASLTLVYGALKPSFKNTRITPRGLFSISGLPTERNHPHVVMKKHRFINNKVKEEFFNAK